VNVNVVRVLDTEQAVRPRLEGLGFIHGVSDAQRGKLEMKTLTVLFVDLNQGFVGLLRSGEIVLVL